MSRTWPTTLDLATRRLSLAALTAVSLLSACTDIGDKSVTGSLASPPPTTAVPPGKQGSVDLAPAAAAHKAEPGNLPAALAYARALRAAGAKAEAMAVLDKAARLKGADRTVTLERGLLALDLGETSKAETLLRHAHDPKAPDWRLHSGLGATLAARGRQQEAQAQFAKALALAPDHPSVLNNLALSYALDGKADEAEKLLRKLNRTRGGEAGRMQQNLALVLGLGGKYEEARRVAETALPAPKASGNTAYLRQLAEARGDGNPRNASLPQPTYQLGGPAPGK